VRLNSHSLFVSPQEAAIKILHMVRFQLWAAGPDHPEAAGFVEQISMLRESATQAYADVARSIFDAAGMQVRPSAGDPSDVFESLALMGNAVSLGLQTDVLPQASTARQLPTGPAGELEDWYPDALALWAPLYLLCLNLPATI